MNVWDGRAAMYRDSDAHSVGDDLDQLVEWARGAETALDVATMGADVEEAEKLRDPSHVRNYSLEEWHELVEQAGLRVVEQKHFEHTFDLDAWLKRTGCTGGDAKEAVRLLGDRAQDGRLTLAKIAILAEPG